MDMEKMQLVAVDLLEDHYLGHSCPGTCRTSSNRRSWLLQEQRGKERIRAIAPREGARPHATHDRTIHKPGTSKFFDSLWSGPVNLPQSSLWFKVVWDWSIYSCRLCAMHSTVYTGAGVASRLQRCQCNARTPL
jgi:hypothetical protein